MAGAWFVQKEQVDFRFIACELQALPRIPRHHFVHRRASSSTAPAKELTLCFRPASLDQCATDWFA
jgi:hypothetical protein